MYMGDRSSEVAVPLLDGGAGGGDAHRDDPLKQRLPVSGSTSFFKTCFNGVNALSGVGILSIPYALASGGWLSLLLFFLVAASTYYTALLIQKCMEMDRTIRTYPDIGHRSFGHLGRALLSVSMNVELYLVSTGFLIVEGDNLHGLFPNMEFQIAGITIGAKNGFILLVTCLLMVLTFCPDNMSFVSYFSAGGVIASSVLVCTVLWAAAVDGVGFHHNNGTLINVEGLPTAVSLYAFCYCAHPVFPTLYNSMSNQRQFSKVMLVCFVFCTLGYSVTAIMGYLMFGPNLQSQITLNLPKDKISSKVAIYTTIINPLAKYTLMVTPIVHAIENRIVVYNPSKGCRVLIRMGLLLSSMAVAVAIPFFEILMSLVGAFLSITASVIFPCLCYLKMSGDYRRFRRKSAAIWGIVLVGVVVLVVGTYVAMRDIYLQLLR
ncbi:amino acid transporter AVT1I-like [Andrographis paniculata]|uniref:amino acid transporter AVT1I-like n=1 Tax=Andrographis paniculata TaxID=175694 RepID=UPI0021E838FC|nr:amino acid transporter AVT1I-like [Andrographis paniculata]